MAVIDIIRLPLIDANLQLEQNSTAVGRVWETFLQYVLTYAGILDVLWGRVVNHRRTVVLLLCWKDRYSRDRFHRGGLGTRMMDPYLERVIEVQFMVDVDVGQLAILAAGRVVLICSEDDTLGQNNGLTLPNLSQLDHFERLSGTGFQSQLGEKEKLSIEPLHVSFMVATTVDTSDLVTSELVAHARDGGWRAELVSHASSVDCGLSDRTRSDQARPLPKSSERHRKETASQVSLLYLFETLELLVTMGFLLALWR
jgi:hypothetical protein